jgi:hypothetical protein
VHSRKKRKFAAVETLIVTDIKAHHPIYNYGYHKGLLYTEGAEYIYYMQSFGIIVYASITSFLAAKHLNTQSV